ncbi:MAG: hypothetical protein PVJ52_03310, partial [Candidatus Woesebacteria bacterium]
AKNMAERKRGIFSSTTNHLGKIAKHFDGRIVARPWCDTKDVIITEGPDPGREIQARTVDRNGRKRLVNIDQNNVESWRSEIDGF